MSHRQCGGTAHTRRAYCCVRPVRWDCSEQVHCLSLRSIRVRLMRMRSRCRSRAEQPAAFTLVEDTAWTRLLFRLLCARDDCPLAATQLVDVLGATEFLPARQSSSDAFAQLCTAVPSACVDILDAICGADDENFNLTRLPEYFVNTPAGKGSPSQPNQ